MTLVVDPQPVPLRLSADGSWRVGDSRVLLDIVIEAFNSGRMPEEIALSYDSLRLEDVYAVISFYLGHRQEVNAYIARRESEADAIWAELSDRTEYRTLRELLNARRSGRE